MHSCHGYDWYSMNEIRFCRPQMLFLIENMELLIDGHYPVDPYVSGYVGGGFARLRAAAPYERADQLAGEVQARLWVDGRTGEAGEALVDEVQNQHIRNYNELSRPAQRVINFISGWRRRRQTYSEWKADQNRKSMVE